MTPLAMPTARPTARPARIAGHRRDRRRGGQRHRAGQPVDRADRQVDPAGDQDERPGAGHDDDPGLLVEDVGEVAEAQERRADHRQHDERDEERDEDPGPADDPAGPLRQRRRGLLGADGVRAHAAVVLVVPNAALTMASSVMSAPDSSATSRPARMTSTPMGQAEDLLDLVRDEQDRHAVGGQADQHLVDVALRADVDAAGRLVGDEHPGLDEQRPGEEQLLLVAAGQRPGRRLEQRRSGHPLEGVADLRPLGPAADEPEPLEAPQAGQADVLADRAAQDQPVVLARLGDQRDAGRRSTRPGRPGRAAPATWTPPGGRRRRAVDRAGQLGSAGADEPGQPDDLAGPEGQRGVLDARARTGPRWRGRPVRRAAAPACRDRPGRPAGRASR